MGELADATRRSEGENKDETNKESAGNKDETKTNKVETKGNKDKEAFGNERKKRKRTRWKRKGLVCFAYLRRPRSWLNFWLSSWARWAIFGAGELAHVAAGGLTSGFQVGGAGLAVGLESLVDVGGLLLTALAAGELVGGFGLRLGLGSLDGLKLADSEGGV